MGKRENSETKSENSEADVGMGKELSEGDRNVQLFFEEYPCSRKREIKQER